MSNFLTSLTTSTMKEERTANFVIRLVMIDGVGFEVHWRRTTPPDHTIRQFREQTRKRAEAVGMYEDQLRELCVIEAKLALGLLD